MPSPKDVFMQMLAKKKAGVKGEAKKEGESVAVEKKEKGKGGFPPKKGAMPFAPSKSKDAHASMMKGC